MKKIWLAFSGGMRLFGEHIAIIVNTVLLTVVYIIGVGLSALLSRIGGKRMMELSGRRKSYWVDLDLKDQKEEDCHKQF